MSACRRIEAELEAWLGGTLEEPARRELEAHLATCADCRELAELAQLSAESPDLTPSILAATSGPACSRAEELLPAFLGEDLFAADRHLVTLHLDTCPDCRALADILVAMDTLLPRFREMTPPAGFAAEVLQTLQSLAPRAPLPEPGRAGASRLPFDVRLARWLRSAGPRLLRRPRFATELAYALTVVGILAVQAMGTFAGAEPQELLTRARAETAEQVHALSEAPAVTGTTATARRLGERFTGLLAGLRRRAGTIVDAAASSLQNEDEPDSSPSTEETP